MVTYEQEIVTNSKADLIITLPDNFLHKRLKVSVEEEPIDEGMAEETARKQRLQAFFKKWHAEGMGADMTGFKFDRDEANER